MNSFERPTLKRVGINNVNDARDLGYKHDGADVALSVGELGRQTEKVLSAHRRDLHREGILKVVGVVHIILRNELLRALVPDRHDVLQKIDELERVAAVAKEEVDSVADLLDVDRLLRRLVLKDQLLQQIECALMVNLQG